MVLVGGRYILCRVPAGVILGITWAFRFKGFRGS